MSRLDPPTLLTAITYAGKPDVDRLLRALAGHLAGEGCKLAGFQQMSRRRPGRTRCDMLLTDVASGECIPISEDHGVHARGCTLAIAELLRAVELAARALEQGPDLLLVNRFGKMEDAGGGFRSLIADAVSHSVPVLIAVPERNLDGWRRFADGLAAEHRFEHLPQSGAHACRVLGFGRIATVEPAAAT